MTNNKPWTHYGRGVGPTDTEEKLQGRTGHTSTEIRTWARQNGYTISNRGSIPPHVEEAFNKARAGE